MPKFFIKANQIENDTINLTGEDVKHIANVLRKQIGDKINICNITTSENFLCQIREISREHIKCNIIEKLPSKTEPNTEVSIFQGLPKAEKMELIIQKYDIVLLAYENEENTTLKAILKTVKNKENLKIGIIIGPEGGIDRKEVEKLVEAGAKTITLGKRILRTETVGLVMTSIIMYELE